MHNRDDLDEIGSRAIDNTVRKVRQPAFTNFVLYLAVGLWMALDFVERFFEVV